MIAALAGEVTGLWLDRAVISTGGVGFLIYGTPRLLGRLRIGERAVVVIAMVVREDALTLFAFDDDDERQVFETVRAVAGVGPKTALALLAVLPPAELAQAVEASDVKAIQRVPGIGAKTAQRLILELTGKLVAAEPGGAGGAAASAGKHRAQVVAALVGLGYAAKAAEAAVDATLADRGAGEVAETDVPSLLRDALRTFAGAKHGS